MKNTNIIYGLDFIQKEMISIEEKEKMRIYCKHDMNHFLSLARICYILNLEHGLKISKDLIYTTALLHDLGRSVDDKNHHIKSFEIAKKALEYTDFSKFDKDLILKAISNHRGDKKDFKTDFVAIFKQADNLSRDCYNCKAYQTCKWSEDRKNNQIIY